MVTDPAAGFMRSGGSSENSAPRVGRAESTEHPPPQGLEQVQRFIDTSHGNIPYPKLGSPVVPFSLLLVQGSLVK